MYNCNKKIYCFDTFRGMVEPSELDKSTVGHKENPKQHYLDHQRADHNEWCYKVSRMLKEILKAILDWKM